MQQEFVVNHVPKTSKFVLYVYTMSTLTSLKLMKDFTDYKNNVLTFFIGILIFVT